jgi:hypothetical protein
MRMRWVGHIAHMGEMRKAYKILVGNSKQKRLLGRPKHKWKGNNREIGRIHVALDRDQWWAVVNMVMNLWVP